MRTILTLPIVIAVLLLTASSCFAQPGPRLQSAEPRGLQIGAATRLTLRGPGLTDGAGEPRLLTPFACDAKYDASAAGRNAIAFDVNVPEHTVPGFYSVRVVTSAGISSPVYVSVDSLPNVDAAAEQPHNIPFAVSGTVQGDGIIKMPFSGAKGETLVVEMEAQRLGSSLRPVVEVLRPDGNVLAVLHGGPHLNGDARQEVTLPVDGDYSLAVHDELYRAPRGAFFRVKAGKFVYATVAQPLAMPYAPGMLGEFNLLGGNVGRDARFTFRGPRFPGTYPVPLAAETGASGRPPLVMVREERVITEDDLRAESEQTLTAPLGISGTLRKQGEQDAYSFAVTPGDKLRLETFADRLGLSVDTVLSVTTADGKPLAGNDDFENTRDSRADIDIPAGVEQIKVTVEDRLRHGGPQAAYYLSATSLTRPDFSLEITESELPLPQGGQNVLLVKANRRGYAGPIALNLSPRPEGSMSGDVAEIPAGMDQALITLAPGNSAQRLETYELAGEATIDGQAVRRAARLPLNNVTRNAPWLAQELVVAGVGPRKMELAWTLPADLAPAPGDTLTIPTKLTRTDAAPGNIRLTLLTNQVVPLFTSGPNTGKPQDEKAIRLAAGAMLSPAGQETPLAVTIPNDLPLGTYDMALVAELVSEDGKRVLDRTVTVATRFKVIGPSFRITLATAAPEAPLAAVLGEGPAAVLKGRVERSGKMSGPITLSLSGLPEGWTAPEIQVPAGQDEFEFPLNLPYRLTAPPAEPLNVQLVGVASAAGLDVLAQESIPLQVAVRAGAAPGLLPLFEDERSFVQQLTEGGGGAALASVDRYSGVQSVRVTPDQKFRTQLPGFKVRIKEHPAAGEYRYLRFAWKKLGGTNIMLQLHANGSWGPQPGGQTPAFRYLAGAPRADAAAVTVSEELPGEWVVVTRDLFADFGEFELDGLALTPSDGEAGLFDHIYLARTEADFAGCPPQAPRSQPLTIFEDDAAFLEAISYGNGQATLVTDDHASGAAAVRITPDQRYNEALPSLGMKIREFPGEGEYRFVRFAWKKKGGQAICVQFHHDGKWGPDPAGHKFRYHSGPGPECYGASINVSPQVPEEWVVVTRDLFADFGEFTLQGLALSPVDGEYGLFDQIYLGRTPGDFELINQQ